MSDAIVALGLVALILWGFNDYLRASDKRVECERISEQYQRPTKVIGGHCFLKVGPSLWVSVKYYENRVTLNPLRVRP